MARNKNQSSPQTIEAKERAAKALQFRKEGLTFDEIAEQVGYKSKQSAHDAVMRAIKEIIREPVNELVTLDLERLDVLWQIQYLNAQAGDVQALNACMKIMERKSKLLGLDAPEKKELTGKDGVDLIPSSGVLVVPSAMDAESWEKAVAEQQKALLNK